MSLLVKGVNNFLGLTDTPASYAAQAGRVPAVNVAENALEFVSVAASQQYPTYVTTALYNAAKNDNWEDLDTGLGTRAWVYLEIVGAGVGVATIRFRDNGEVRTIHTSSFNHCTLAAGDRLTYVLVCTDAAGIVEWRSSNVADQLTVTMLAYWLNPPTPTALLFSGLTVNAWQTLNVGVPRALCMLKVLITAMPGGFCNYLFRMVGDGLECEYGMEWGQQQGVGSICYIFIASDAAGNIEYKMPPANQEVEIYLYSYILGADFPVEQVYSGAYPAAYTDLDTPFGRGFALVKQHHTLVAGNPLCSFRANGEAASVDESAQNCTPSGIPLLNNIAYCFVPLDTQGIIEWKGAAAQSCTLTVAALSG